MTRSNSALARNSLLRQLKRVNNKSRFGIHRGELEDAETLFLDEGKLSWGVDNEDANEQHLQEALTASQRRHNDQAGPSHSREKAEDKSAYIPTPDSTGVVKDYEPIHTWIDPTSYVKSSETPDECLTGALAHGFTYYMEERDRDWLVKNNQQARGEGTSAFGALSVPASGTRSDASRKGKGKEPDIPQPVTMTEDELELVMGILEQVTHDKVPFMHHHFEPKMIPALSEFQQTFSSPLPNTMFASFVVPAWIPSAPQLLRIARAIYPYWKERRIERQGHRVIPCLNLDESDTPNESYICFRRRDVKVARKTRQAQVTSGERLSRLNAEINVVVDLASSTLAREKCKKELNQHAMAVWEQRQTFVELKNKVAPGIKGDEELLFDKESSPKKPRTENKSSLKRLQISGSPTVAQEMSIKPRDRALLIQSKMEAEIQKQKQKDRDWDDQTDNPYQPRPVPYPSRLFKVIPPNNLPTPSSSMAMDVDEEMPSSRNARALRIRLGRGGCLRIDRRSMPPWSPPAEPAPNDEQDESLRRMKERWRFDSDDVPAAGPDGPEEEDRILVDDYDSKFMLPKMLLLPEADQQRLLTNVAIPVVTQDGRTTFTIPFRLGAPRGPVMVAQNSQAQSQAQQAYSQVPPVSRPVHMTQAIAPRYPQPSAHASSSTTSIPSTEPKSMGPPAVPQPQHAQLAQANGTAPSTSGSIPQAIIPHPTQQNQAHVLPNGTANRSQLPMSVSVPSATHSTALTAAYLAQHQQQLQQQQQAAQAQSQLQQQSQVHQQQQGPHQSPPQSHVQALHGPGQNGIDSNGVPNRQRSASPQKTAHHLPYHYVPKHQLGVNGYNGAMANSALFSAAAAASLGQQQPPQLTAAQIAQINNAFAQMSQQDFAALGPNNARVLQTYAAQLQANQQQAQLLHQAQQAQQQQQQQQQSQQNGVVNSPATFSSAIPNPANMTFKLPTGRQQAMQWPPASTQASANGVAQGVNGAGVHGNSNGLEVPNGVQRNSHSPNPYGQTGMNGTS